MTSRAVSPFVLSLVAAVSGCIGVPAKKTTAEGNPAPARYCATGTTTTKDGLIDDFEDGNTRVAQVAGRGGYWYKSADSMGSKIGPDDFKPVKGGPDGSLAIHAVGETVTGNPQDAWGAQFGANFSGEGVYDASKYVGVRFKARIGEGSTQNFRFRISDINTHGDLGVCKTCWNHFGRDINLSTEWQEYEVMFGSLQQAPYWGDPRPSSVTVSKIYGFDFQIAPGQKFDIWVDDIEFIACK